MPMSGQESFTLTGHTGAVRAWRSAPTGERIVSGSEDTDTEGVGCSERPGHTDAPGHTVGVTSVAFSPDGQRIVSGSISTRR